MEPKQPRHPNCRCQSELELDQMDSLECCCGPLDGRVGYIMKDRDVCRLPSFLPYTVDSPIVGVRWCVYRRCEVMRDGKIKQVLWFDRYEVV